MIYAKVEKICYNMISTSNPPKIKRDTKVVWLYICKILYIRIVLRISVSIRWPFLFGNKNYVYMNQVNYE